jgi:hypothetical protein
LAKQPNFTVLIVQGHTDGEMVVDKFWQVEFDLLRHRGNSLLELRLFIKRWYEQTESDK